MIMQKKKKNQYIIKLCYKVIFFIEISYLHTEYFPISYKGVLSLNRVGISIKKKLILYKFKRISLITAYTVKHIRGDFFYIYDYWYYFYLNEDRKLSYTGFLLNSKFNYFHDIFFKNVYKHYSFFFYSFFFKTSFFKNFHVYKNQHLMNLLWNLTYSFTTSKNLFFLNKIQNFFLLKFEFYNTHFLLNNNSSYEYPIEFFFFKKELFFKKKKNYLSRNNAYIFSENSQESINIFNEEDKIFFFQKKFSTTNFFFFKDKKNLPKTAPYFLIQNFFFYKNLQLLFIK